MCSLLSSPDFIIHMYSLLVKGVKTYIIAGFFKDIVWVIGYTIKYDSTMKNYNVC